MKNYKIGYSFSKITGEFISKEIVYLEKRTGEYPHADNVTFIEPPYVGENQKQIWTGKDWKIVSDYRGRTYYNENGEPMGEIENLSDIDDKIIIPPPVVEFPKKVSWNPGIGDWNIVLEKGYKFDSNNNIVEMTAIEKIEAGLDELPDDMKIENNELVLKTIDDYFKEGKITVKEYNEHQRQMREGTYMTTTDKIGLMVLRGEATMEEWQAAIQAVKEKWPYKE